MKKIIINQNKHKCSFIHPTKCGGTSIENYFKYYYRNYINSNEHNLLCTDNNEPIIIIRDPIERFISMFKYWKYGSEKYIRDDEFIEKYKNYTIKDFIKLIKNNKKDDLYVKFTWDVHFFPQTYWINNTNYKNIIIINYCKDLSTKINLLLLFLNIPNKNIPLKSENISKNIDKIVLDYDDISFIKKHYSDDYKLIDDIYNSPELFRVVI